MFHVLGIPSYFVIDINDLALENCAIEIILRPLLQGNLAPMQTSTQHTKVFGSRLKDISIFISDMFEEDLHVKRIESLANATLGVMTGATLAISFIGQALAQARGLTTKHAVKQVVRLLSNSGIVVWDCFARWLGTRSTGCSKSSAGGDGLDGF